MEISNAYERALLECQMARDYLVSAIESYRVASIALHRAAEAVCDAENLPANGEAQGIVWTVPLLGR